jgi:hypothetical protein
MFRRMRPTTASTRLILNLNAALGPGSITPVWLAFTLVAAREPRSIQLAPFGGTGGTGRRIPTFI